MSISFSGLASGLDTTSWVESLVALKRAKVETLQEQRENVLISQNTLNSIKSFFSSFRSVIERVTDTKFNIVSMDLFAQNIATSANLSVVSAVADTNADEGIYQVLVDKLATNTQATSNYSYVTTIIQTTTATSDSYLKHLGVTAGNILVKVGGIDYGVNIAEDDTIASFITKLQNIGVNASFNDKTGVFNMKLNRSDINDIGNTGICNALHLEGVNEGYATENKLQVENVETFYYVATNDTKMSELGVQNGTVTVRANEADYNFTINEYTTLGSFISQLNSKNIVASLDETGVFTLSDAEIVNEGTTDILSALGLEVGIYSKTQSATGLKHEITVTETATATTDTLLKDIGTGTAIYDGQTVIVKNSNNATRYITLNSNSTVGDLLTGLQDAGLSATIKSDGTVEISGGQIIGGSFNAVSALGLTEEAYSTSATSANQLQHDITLTENATLSTHIVEDLGVKAGYFKVTDVDGNVSYQKVSSGETISDFISKMTALGVNVSLDSSSGVVTIAGGTLETLTDSQVASLVSAGTIVEANSSLRVGSDLITNWFGQSIISADQTNVNSTSAKSAVLQQQITTTIAATASTKLGKLGVGTSGTAILDVRGEYRTINVTSSMTVQDLVDALAAQGISSTWDDTNSTLSINNAAFTGGSSNVADALGMTSTITGRYISSNALSKSVTNIVDATGSTTLGEFGITNGMSTQDKTVSVYDANNNLLGTIVVRTETTLQELENSIDGLGINASLSNGIFTITDGYIKNATLETNMGLDTDIASSYVLGSVITQTTTVTVTGASKLGDVISTIGTTSAVSGGYNLTFNGNNIAVTADTTLDVMMQYIRSAGGTASLDANGYLSIGGGTLAGTVATALGITSTTSTSQVSSTGNSLVTNEEKFADLNTKFSDLNIGDTSYYVYNSLGNAIATVNVSSTSTIESFFAGLASNGITGSISNGVISVSSTNGNYINGTTASALGIGTKVVTTVISTTQNSSSKVMYSATITATEETELGCIMGMNVSSAVLTIHDKNSNQIFYTNLSSGTSIEGFFNLLQQYGITGTISDGVISLYSSEGNYIDGVVATALGLDKTLVSSVTTTIAKSATSTAIVNYTLGMTAKMESTIADFVTLPTNKGIEIYKHGGDSAVGTITVSNTMTFQQLANSLSGYDISLDVSSAGVVSLNYTGDYYANSSGDMMKALKLKNTNGTHTVTQAKTATSTVAVSNTVTNTAIGSTTLTTIVGTTLGALEIRDADGSLLHTTTLASTTTVDGFKTYLNSWGITATLVDGVISLSSTGGNYITGALATNLGIGAVTVATGKTVGIANTSSSAVSVPGGITTQIEVSSEETITKIVTSNATELTTLGSLGISNFDLKIYDSDDTLLKAYTYNASTTLGAVMANLRSHDFDASISKGVMTITSKEDELHNNYISGGLATALGITSTKGSSNGTIATSVTTQALTEKATALAQGYTKISDCVDDLGEYSDGSGYDFCIVYKDNRNPSNSRRFYSFDQIEEMTYNQLFRELENYDIYATMNNGRIEVYEMGDYVIHDNDFARALGFDFVTTSDERGVVSSEVITYKEARGVESWMTCGEAGLDGVYWFKEGQFVGGGEYIEAVTITSDMTVQDMCSVFSSSTIGISLTVDNGYFSYDHYGLFELNNSSLAKLGISTRTGSSSTASDYNEDIIYSSSAITYKKNGVTYTANLDTTLAEIWLPTGTAIAAATTYKDGGGYYSGTNFYADYTIRDMLMEFEKLGLHASFSAGKFYIIETENAHLVCSSELNSVLKLTGNTTTTYSTTYADGTTVITRKTASVLTTLSARTTQADLGKDGTVSISGRTFSSDFTLGQISYLLGEDSELHVDNGRVYVDGVSISSDFTSAFKLSSNDYTYATGSDNLVQYEYDKVISYDTKLNNIIPYSNNSFTYLVLKTVGNESEETTITIEHSSGETLAGLKSRLANYGINLSISGGAITISNSTNGEYYLSSWSSNLNSNIFYHASKTPTLGYKYTMSNSKALQYQESVAITGTETFGVITKQLFNSSITVIQDGTVYSTNISTGTTVNEFIGWLDKHGLEASLVDGIFSIESNSNAYIYDSWNDNINSYNDNTILNALNISTSTLTATKTAITSDMSLGAIGVDFGMTTTISIYSESEGDLTYAFTKDKTIAEVLSDLNNYGITGTYHDGIMSLTPRNGYYIKNSNNALFSFFNISGQDTYKEVKNRYNDSSNSLTYQKTYTLTTTSTLSNLGLTSDQYIYGIKDGQEWNVMVSPTSTFDSMKNALANYGITATVSNGKLTLAGSGNSYITNMSSGLKNLLKMDVGEDKTYEDVEVAKAASASGSALTSTTTSSINSSTTFANLGFAAATKGYITVVSNGTEKTVTVSATTTMSDLNAMLTTHGAAISWDGGKVTLAGNGTTYIKGISDNVKNALKVNAGSGNTYTTTVQNGYVNDSSDAKSYTRTDLTATTSTKLSAINGYNNGNGQIKIHKSDGTYATVTLSGSDTVESFFNKISAYGLTGTINGDGIVTILGTGNVYLEAVSGGSNVLTAMKMSNVVENVTTATLNTGTSSWKQTITVNATGTTALNTLKNTAGTSITFNASNKTTLTLKATNTIGAVTNYTLTFSTTSTLNDVIDALEAKGIKATIDTSGRFAVTSTTLSDFDLTGSLSTVLMGSYTKNYDSNVSNNVSMKLLEKKVVALSDSDTLSALGVNSGNIVIRQNGVNNTVTIDTTSVRTVGDFRNLLSSYGFSSYIDSEGRLAVTGVGDSSLSVVSGGSNILNKFGLTNWKFNNVVQTSSKLTDEEVITSAATKDVTLAELKNSSGTSLGITSGKMYVYQDGTRNLVSISNTQTLESLANTLSKYGITMGVNADGSLYFDGNNNSYVTTTGIASGEATNLLSKLGIEGNWSTRQNSSSSALSYVQEEVISADGSVKMVDLLNSSGSLVGITTGAYSVYKDGVKTTEYINADTSVNDFLATLNGYGFNATILSDGTISIKASGNTYIETAATAGANSNVVDKLFSNYSFNSSYTSNGLTISETTTETATLDTKLSDIKNFNFQEGYITVVKDGVTTDVYLSSEETVGSLINELAQYGINASLKANGQLAINAEGGNIIKEYTGGAQASNFLDLMNIDDDSDWTVLNNYNSSPVQVIDITTTEVAATRETLLSDLGVTTGEYYIYNNGVRYTALISNDETIGSLVDTLRGFGIQAALTDDGTSSTLKLLGSGDSYLTASNTTGEKSNVVSKLFTSSNATYEYSGDKQTSTTVTSYTSATEETLLSYYGVTSGKISVTIDGMDSSISISADETIGSMLNKFNSLGIEATISDGDILIQSGYKDFTINSSGTTSNVLTKLGLKYSDDLGGYVASSTVCEQTTTTVETRTLSAAAYVDDNTKLGALAISNGTFTVYKNGQKATLNIDSEQTLGNLRSQLAAAFGNVDMIYDENGYLKISSNNPNDKLEAGSTTDTSNIKAVLGLNNDESGTIMSARALYKVNANTKLTEANNFRLGTITEGTFKIGDVTFEINENTTMSDIISQINTNDEAMATAYWDSIGGKLVIQSRNTGSAMINIEAGTSNFTDVMGFTQSTWAADGSVQSTRILADSQELGGNARFSINGTYYSSTSNKVTSDVTRIEGLTLDLKGVSEGQTVEVKVERNKENLADAVSEIVDAYNTLIENIDTQLASGGKLEDQQALKLIRNQIRSLMTSSHVGSNLFKNLDAVGLKLDSASATNVSTSTINKITFDRDTFLEAYDTDRDALKSLLVGTESQKGVFMKIEDILESALTGASGYFASTDRSLASEASRLGTRIDRMNATVERYKRRLENKFQAMDMLISKMQDQYSSFLAT